MSDGEMRDWFDQLGPDEQNAWLDVWENTLGAVPDELLLTLPARQQPTGRQDTAWLTWRTNAFFLGNETPSSGYILSDRFRKFLEAKCYRMRRV